MFETAQQPFSCAPQPSDSNLFSDDRVPSVSSKYMSQCYSPNSILSPTPDDSYSSDFTSPLSADGTPSFFSFKPPNQSPSNNPDFSFPNGTSEYELFPTAFDNEGRQQVLPEMMMPTSVVDGSDTVRGDDISGTPPQTAVPSSSSPVQIEGRNNPEVCKDEKITKRAAPKRLAKPTKLFTEDFLKNSPLPANLEPPAILGGKLPPAILRKKKKTRVYTEKELKRRRKKGLPDDSDSESEERRQVRLPRPSLLKITTSQMSEFVNFLRLHAELTPSQQDELSKQKRLVKNRESACRFRAKKELNVIESYERMMELEGDIITLRAENEKLRKALLQATGSSELPQEDLSSP